MRARKQTCIHEPTFNCKHVHTLYRSTACVHTCIHARACIHTDRHTCVCAHARIHTCIRARATCVNMHTCKFNLLEVNVHTLFRHLHTSHIHTDTCGAPFFDAQWNGTRACRGYVFTLLNVKMAWKNVWRSVFLSLRECSIQGEYRYMRSTFFWCPVKRYARIPWVCFHAAECQDGTKEDLTQCLFVTVRMFYSRRMPAYFCSAAQKLLGLFLQKSGVRVSR